MNSSMKTINNDEASFLKNKCLIPLKEHQVALGHQKINAKKKKLKKRTYKGVAEELKKYLDNPIKYNFNRTFSSIPSFTPNCFWFIINSLYFNRGYYLIYGINAKSQIDTIMNYRRSFSPKENDILLQETQELKSQNIDFAQYYVQLENELNQLQKENDEKLELIHTQLHQDYEYLDKNYALSKGDKYNISIDIYQISDYEYSYMDYLESIHFEENYKNNSSRFVGTRTNEIICNVCLEGDYSSDNFIVLCSVIFFTFFQILAYFKVCNICVHQKCYNLTEIPKNEWICDVCLKFGQGSADISCILCCQNGGTLREVNFGEELVKKTNTCNKNSFEIYEQNYQNIFSPMKKNKKETVKKAIWAHLSCIFWIPELKKHIDLNNSLHMKDFIRIKTWRLMKICGICNKENVGAVIRCSGNECKMFFHVECGIRNGVHFEKNDSNFNAYCQRHIPFELKKTLYSRIMIMRKEITVFMTALEVIICKLKVKLRRKLEVAFANIQDSSNFIVYLQKKGEHFKILSVDIPKLSTIMNKQKNMTENLSINNKVAKPRKIIRRKQNKKKQFQKNLIKRKKINSHKNNTRDENSESFSTKPKYIIIDSEEENHDLNSGSTSNQDLFDEFNEYQIIKVKTCQKMEPQQKIGSKSTSESENMSITHSSFIEK